MARLPMATRESVPEAQRAIFDEMGQGTGGGPSLLGVERRLSTATARPPSSPRSTELQGYPILTKAYLGAAALR